MKSPYFTEERHQDTAERQAGDSVAASPAAGLLDAPASNRASNRCNSARFEVLSRHIDSLEVSIPGELWPSRAKQLQGLKEQAQSRQQQIRAEAQLVVGDQCFEVKDKGAGLFPFILSNDSFYIKLARPGNTTLPFAFCQFRNAYLLHVAPAAAIRALVQILRELGQVTGSETVSRVDLAVDFATDIPIKAWPAEWWVTRLDHKNSYSDGDHFTGWNIGRKSTLQLGLYDKTREIEKVSGKTYLYDLWKQAGWVPWESVWRAEGRFRRQTLSQFGLSSVDEVRAAAGALWQYITGTSVRLAVPSETDTTRSRWPLHPLWDELTRVDWGLPPLCLTRSYKGLGAPKDRTLAIRTLSVLTSLMAREGVLEPGASWKQLRDILFEHLKSREIATGRTPEEALIDKAQEKGRRWHTLRNVPAPPAVPPQRPPVPQAGREPGSD